MNPVRNSGSKLNFYGVIKMTKLNKISNGAKNTKKLALSILPEKLGICHFDKNSLIPDWALEKTNFTSITRTFGATRNRGLTPANTFTQILHTLIGIVKVVCETSHVLER